MKFEFWKLALVGYFQVSVSGKPSEIEDIGQYTTKSWQSIKRKKYASKVDEKYKFHIPSKCMKLHNCFKWLIGFRLD